MVRRSYTKSMPAAERKTVQEWGRWAETPYREGKLTKKAWWPSDRRRYGAGATLPPEVAARRAREEMIIKKSMPKSGVPGSGTTTRKLRTAAKLDPHRERSRMAGSKGWIKRKFTRDSKGRFA